MNTSADDKPNIGVLCLETSRPTDPRWVPSTCDPRSFDCGYLEETIKDVWVDDILSGDSKFAPSFIEAAVTLEQRGADCLMANCGFAISYKKAIEKHVSIPVAVSSLALLPQLHALLLPNRKIGVMTFDAGKLTDRDLRAAWPAFDRSLIVVGDIRETESWADLRKEHPVYDYDMMHQDVHGAVKQLVDWEPSIQFLLFECTAFPPFATSIRKMTGLPVFDFFTLAEMIIGSLSLTTYQERRSVGAARAAEAGSTLENSERLGVV